MIESSLARRYAKALLALGEEKNENAKYLEYLNGLEIVIKENEELVDVLSNRFMDLKARLRVIDGLAEKTNAPAEITHFLKLLAIKGRIHLLTLMIQTFRGYVYALQNKVVAKVISARELSPADYDSLVKEFGKISGKTIVLEKQIKPDVLGGLAVQINGEIFDGTVKSRLNQLAFEMKNATIN